MEEWQNGHDQPGYHYHQEQERKPVETPGKRFWKMWGPLLIKWGIGIGIWMVAGLVFTIIMMLRGTPGSNRFGPDPLQPADLAEAFR